MERDHISLPRYLPASFVTTVTNIATPRNTVLQQAGANVGQPNQLNRRPSPEKSLLVRTASP
jgi:hypothetical protein